LNSKTLYLPVEIKQREYDAQIALAAEAAIRGYKVFLGTHAAIFALLQTNKVPIGIFLEKGMPSRERLPWLRQKCLEVWVMDAEISPIHTTEVLISELPSRIFSDGIDGIDKYLVVGEMAYIAACKYFGEQKFKVIKTGWPRMEIAGSLGAKIYTNEIASIKRKYQTFYLFASSFAGNKDPIKVVGQRKATLHEPTPFWNETAIQKRYEKFIYTIECLKIWDADPRVPTIIVRPHVAESKEIWREKLGTLKKTFIEEEGNATSWIYASSGVIHQGSTLSIQSSIARKENFFLRGASIEDYSEISEKLSDVIVSKTCPPVPESLRNPSYPNPNYFPQIVDSMVYSPPEGAISTILEKMDQVPSSPGSSVTTLNLIISQFSLRSLRRAIGLLRDEAYWKLGRINLHPQSRSIPGGLGRKEISRIFKAMNYNSSVVASRKTLNLWEFKAKK
jgi:surface carbohydrate biosynthesis protein